MDAQIPGYNAVYDNRANSPMYNSKQPMGGFSQSSLPPQTSMQGMNLFPQTTIPSAPQQGSPSTAISTMPITDLTQPMPMTTGSTQFLNGFLRTQIGKRVRVEFLVGTNTSLDKYGKLLDVGANFIVLQETMSDDILTCDFFSIKFVTIYR